MDDDIAEIQKHPCSCIIAFDFTHGISCALELLLHAVRERLNLAAVRTIGNNEIIRQYRYAADVNHVDIDRFLVFQCHDGCSGHGKGFVHVRHLRPPHLY